MDDGTKLLVELIEKASAEYERRLQERHSTGAEKYGPLAFFEKNTIEEAMEEVLDCSNYLRYTYIKLYLINIQLDAELGGSSESPEFVANPPDLRTNRPLMSTDEETK